MKAQGLTKETILSFGIKKRDFPDFKIGDTIAVSQWITEGNKRRIQIFEGDVIASHKKGASSTFTVRKIGANSIAVERIFPYYSDILDSIHIVRRGDVRRAKLYYVRDRIGKKARVKELILTKEDKEREREKMKQAKEMASQNSQKTDNDTKQTVKKNVEKKGDHHKE